MLIPKNSVNESLNCILKEGLVNTVFQPIYSLDNSSILGYEALSRGPKGSVLESPIELFNCAELHGCLSELELLCRRRAISRFSQLQLPGLLFLNICPNTLLDPAHPQGETLRLIKQAKISVDRVVIEITEGQRIKDDSLFQQAIHHYRELGFKIAIDDLGSGYSGLRQWSELQPDIVKIDRYFIDNCDQNRVKNTFLKAIVALAQSMGARVVAEGIERQEELLLLQQLGIDMAQGFFLAKPQSLPSLDPIPKGLMAPAKNEYKPLEVFTSMTQKSKHTDGLDPVSWAGREDTIGHLAIAGKILTLEYSCEQARSIFSNNSALDSLVVIDSASFPVGVMHRDQLSEVLSSRYGNALYADKLIGKIMDRKTMIVDGHDSVDSVSQAVAESDIDMRRHILVVDKGRYLGLVPLRHLLKKITEDKVSSAQYANPLTLLPGNIAIDKAISSRLNDSQFFSLAYFDLNHFKPFNDLYGYAVGDDAIKLLAQVIEQKCQEVSCFVGHIGGDDFMVLFDNGDSQDVCQAIVTEFDHRSRAFFSDQHIKDNGYWSTDRSGEQQFMSLLSLSVGLVFPDINLCTNSNEVATLAADAKKESKKAGKSNVFVCQRRSLQFRELSEFVTAKEG